MKFNPKLENFKPYVPVTENYKIRLDANESCFNVNRRFLSKFRKEISRLDFNRYPDPTCAALREAFGKCFRVRPEQVVCGNGSDELLNLIAETFASKGDRVVTFAQDFSMYAFYSRLMECDVLELEKREDLTVDVEEAISACREGNARLLFLSNPCNPTSLVLDRKQVNKLVSSVPDTLVVLDEAYMDFSSESYLGELKKHDNLIVLKTLSKAFGMAAIRLGFAVTSTEIAGLLNTTRSPYNVNALTQIAGRLALSSRAAMEGRAEELTDSKTDLFNGLKKIEEISKGDFAPVDGETNFVYVRTSKVRQIDAYLRKRGISVRAFDGYLRITAGTDEENAELLQCLDEAAGILWIE